MDLALPVYPFATQDLRNYSSVFPDFLYEVRQTKVRKVTKPIFEKSLLESGGPKKSQKSLKNEVLGVLTKI